MRQPKKYFIVSGTYNAENYVERCVRSVSEQVVSGDYSIVHIIVNDGSTDKTAEVIKRCTDGKSVVVIDHSTNKGSIASQLSGFAYARQHGDIHDVIIQLDGDDWFNTNEAVSIIHSTYTSTDCGATYGDYVCTDNAPSGCRVPNWKCLREDLKKNGWALSAPRTFRVGYTAHLHEDLLKDENGELYPAAYDVAIYLPIAEMAGEHKVVWIRKPIMVYNRDNPIRDAKVRYFDQISSAHACYARPSLKEVQL